MKNLVILLLALTVLSGCAAPVAANKTEAAYRQVTAAEAASLMETEEDYILLDVRTQAEYEEKHIPNAICIPNETIGSSEIPGLPDKDQLILVYCRSGNRSKQAAAKLAALGYTNVVEFGGIRDWSGETETGDNSPNSQEN